jgi:hypothetical protein
VLDRKKAVKENSDVIELGQQEISWKLTPEIDPNLKI